MHFEKSGKINTEETVKLAVKTAKERNINYKLLLQARVKFQHILKIAVLMW